MPNQLLRSLPSIERLLERPSASQLSVDLSRDRVRDLLRQITDELREEVVNGKWPPASGSEQLIQEVELRLELRAAASAQPSLRRVINATGVIIHTNLGRAPLARRAIEAISEAAAYYSNLEYNLTVGERGHRETHCQELLARLGGSEAAVVANNNAAAVLLLLNTLAEGGEVIVSRGELIRHVARSRHDESHSNLRLRAGDQRANETDTARASVKLSHHRVHRASNCTAGR